MKSVVMVLLALGCVSAPVNREPEPSVLVSYHGVGTLKVWVQVDGGTPRRLGSVTAGRAECFRLPDVHGTLTLWTAELGSRDAVRSPDFNLSYRYWVWSLASHLTTTRINLVPVEHSCFSKKTEART